MDKKLQALIVEGDVVKLWSWMSRQPVGPLEATVAYQVLPSKPKSLLNSLDGVRGFHALVAYLSEDRMGEGRDCYCGWCASISRVLRFYATAGHDINAKVDLVPYRRKRFGTTPLLMAIQSRKPRLAGCLIDAGADVNLPDNSGFTPFHWIALSPSAVEDVAYKLINAGADISSFSLEAQPLIHLAVDEGRLDLVQLALANRCDINVSYPYDVIKEESWAKVTSRYHVGDVQKETKLLTAVSRAVRMRKISVLIFLLREPNARVSIDDLHFCILEGDSKVACMLLYHFDDQTLRNDLINGKSALLSLGKKAFVPTNEEDLSGYTIQLVIRYVSCGWDINSVDNFLKANRNDTDLPWSVAANPLKWILTNFESYILSLAIHECTMICNGVLNSENLRGDCDLGEFADLVARLCSAGSNVCDFRMETILQSRSCLIANYPHILKNLYYAGANLGDVRSIVETWQDKSGNVGYFSNKLQNFWNWYELETSKPPTLGLICLRKVRMLLESPNLKQVLIQDLKLPPGSVNAIFQRFSSSDV